MPLIVFDLDGTLIDSRRDLADSTNEMLETYGAPGLAEDEVAAMVGDGARVLVERALGAAGVAAPVPEALSRFREIYSRRLVAFTRPYDGIVETLQDAATRAHLAVLTNKPETPTLQLLDAFDLARYFRWVIGGDSTFPRKPDPAGLRYLIDEARAAPGSALFVGDSMIDVRTARNAGVAICVALYGFGKARGDLELQDADLRASTPSALTGVLLDWLESGGIDDGGVAR
jgi:phosphoglycolate phosphatase